MNRAEAALPFNLDAERSVLGIVLFDNDALYRIEALAGRHFYEPAHQRLYDEISARVTRGDLADPTLLAQRFIDDEAFGVLGGTRYLADLIDHAPPPARAPDYAREIIDLALRRDLIRATSDLAVAAQDRSRPARAVIEEAETTLFALAEERQESARVRTFGEAAKLAVQRAAEAHRRDGRIAGLATGLADLDQKLGGLYPSDLLILAGRPSMGKTALATNIAFNVARNYRCSVNAEGERITTAGGVVLFFSLEMSADQLAARVLADQAGVSADRMRKGRTSAEELAALHDRAAELDRIPLHINEIGGLHIAKLCAQARRQKRQTGLDLVVIDYLQLITGDRGRAGNRTQEVSDITAALKALAKELEVPVLALSQLSRQVEARDDKRPQLADLRESGSIEQDADVVMFVFREAYYLERAEPREGTDEHLKWQEQVEACRHRADVIIGKQRHGPIGTVRLGFDSDTARFSNLAHEAGYGGLRLPYGDDD